jgi:hypothetical protein
VSKAPHVYQAMIEVMRDIAAEGISKDRRNRDQGFNFRGVEDVLNTLSPLLVKHNLLILPQFDTIDIRNHESAKGGYLSDVFVKARFDIVSAIDGSTHTVNTFGQGMDSADKATNKAMSGAFKYACFFGFCVPTEGVLDEGDYDTPYVHSSERGRQPERGERNSGDERSEREPVRDRDQRAPMRDARGPEDHDARRSRNDDVPEGLRPSRSPKDDEREKPPAQEVQTPRQTKKPSEDRSIADLVENEWPGYYTAILDAKSVKALKVAAAEAYTWAKLLEERDARVAKNLMITARDAYEERTKEFT